MTSVNVVGIDPYVVARLDSDAAEQITKYRRLIDSSSLSSRLQVFYAFLANAFETRAGCLVVAGKYADSRGCLRDAALAWQKVFQLNGTTYVTVTKGGVANRLPDNSIANSRLARKAVYYSVIAGDIETAVEISQLDKTTVAHEFVIDKSLICSPGDILVLRVIGAILRSETVAPGNLTLISTAFQPRLEHERRILAACLLGDTSQFRDLVWDYISWHQEERTEEKNRSNPSLFACFPAVALALIARRMGMDFDATLVPNCLTLELLKDTISKHGTHMP